MTDWWNTTPLHELDDDQWESLCDGCGRCCLHKLEDAATGEVFHTRVRCRYLVDDTCRCSDYDRRSALVPDCARLERGTVSDLEWLPLTCAYRLRANGQPLPTWHYLVCDDREAVHAAGVSVRGRTVSDEFVHPDGYDEHIVAWVDGP